MQDVAKARSLETCNIAPRHIAETRGLETLYVPAIDVHEIGQLYALNTAVYAGKKVQTDAIAVINGICAIRAKHGQYAHLKWL